MWYNGPDNFLPEPDVEEAAVACRFGHWRFAWTILEQRLYVTGARSLAHSNPLQEGG